MLVVLLALLALLAFGPAALGAEEPGRAGRPHSIAAFVSIAPQSYFVERIGGDKVDVAVLVGPGQSPHTFEPTPKQMALLAETDVYFAVGLPFEARLLEKVRALNPDVVIVDTTEGIAFRSIDGSGTDEHSEHGDPHGHEQVLGGPEDRAGLQDPHVWLDPARASVLARNTCEALTGLAPGDAPVFLAGLDDLLEDLTELDEELRASLAPLAGQSVFVFHPAFGYFTDAYGLTQVAVETGGMEPGARALAALMERAVVENVRVVFVQPQFSTRSASALAEEIGGAVVPIDPLSGDYIENLRSIAREVTAALTEAPVEEER